jgi:hypothetical protein
VCQAIWVSRLVEEMMGLKVSAPVIKMDNQSVSVFCTGKNRVVKIARSSSEMVLQTTKHTMIYPGSGPSLEVIALRPMV